MPNKKTDWSYGRRLPRLPSARSLKALFVGSRAPKTPKSNATGFDIFKVESYGSAISNLKTVFVTHKDKFYLFTDDNDINYLKPVYKACFTGRALKGQPKNDNDKNVAFGALKTILTTYKKTLEDPIFKSLHEQFAQTNPDNNIMEFINYHLAAINMLFTHSTNFQRERIYKDSERYDVAWAIVGSLVSPEFTAALESIRPPLLEYVRSGKIDVDAMKFIPDMMVRESVTPPPSLEDPLVAADLRGLLSVTNPTEKDLISRLGKQAAKRSNNLLNRYIETATFSFIKNSHDFTKQCTDVVLFKNIQKSVARLSDQTGVRTSGKTSQYDREPGLQRTHNDSKVKLYKGIFKAELIGDDRLAIKGKRDDFEFFNIAVQTNTKKNVELASISVPGAANKRFETQAMLVDQLREMSKALGAVSVNISSYEADGTVNIDNVLKGAFNALHANLVPKFDAKTRNAIKAFEATAVDYVHNDADDKNSYTGRYRSKEFATMLTYLNPDLYAVETFENIYNRFTDVMSGLHHDPSYTDKRPHRPA